MSFAGRAANSSGCVARPRAREIGLIGFAAQIRRSSLTGSYVMETAEHREQCESRGSRTVLGAPGGEIPPGDSTFSSDRPAPDALAMSASLRSRPNGRNGAHYARARGLTPRDGPQDNPTHSRERAGSLLRRAPLA